MISERPSILFLIGVNLWCWSWLVLLSILVLFFAGPWLICGRCLGYPYTFSIRKGIWLYGRLFLKTITPVIRLDFSVEEITTMKSGIIIVNHQSWLDPYLIAVLAGYNICFLVRAWPFKRLFFFGPFMRLAGYIETEGFEIEDVLAKCRQELNDGAIVICFPEGTRGYPGALGRFHSGIFKLATELNIGVTPLVIHDSGLIMPKGSLLFNMGCIKIELLSQVKPFSFTNATIAHGAMRRHVRYQFANALNVNLPERNRP